MPSWRVCGRAAVRDQRPPAPHALLDWGLAEDQSDRVIDWVAAVKLGIKVAPTGPDLTQAEAAEAVADLRRFSREAELKVREVTGLGEGLPVLDGVVVDRPHWIAASAQGMAILSAPMSRRVTAQARARAQQKSGVRRHAAKPPSAAAAAPIGTVLAFLSGKVLGQYDPFVPDPAQPDQPGRLLLVAPNIVKVERELGLDPTDFRMWVCLHESTHRLQFTAVDWLREYFRGLVTRFADEADLDAAALAARVKEAWKARLGGEKASWIESTQTPAQREIFDQLLALMTLLEGHADYVMDAVGPDVIPSVATIRSAFSARRRQGAGPIDRFFRRLLGMDMKIRQYVQGGAFVHAVVEQVGMTAFNAVWERPENLPTRNEITDPAAWVARIQP